MDEFVKAVDDLLEAAVRVDDLWPEEANLDRSFLAAYGLVFRGSFDEVVRDLTALRDAACVLQRRFR